MTSAEDYDFGCRILLVKAGGSEESRYLNLKSFGKTGTNQAKAFHPLMLKLFSQVFLDGNVFPALYVDFGQWQEEFRLTCQIGGEQSDNTTPQAMARYLSDLRSWIIKSQSSVTNTLYLQIFWGATSLSDPTETCHLDARGVPVLLGNEKGFRGLFMTVPEWGNWRAGDGEVEFTLRFGVGIVLP